MTKQTVNIGTTANDQSADTIRIAFDKVNDNFNELYSAFGTDSPTTNQLKFVADDSTGVSMSLNETFKISGGDGITTSITGDELTITAAATGEPIRFVGDDSTGIDVNSGNTLKITGSNGITATASQVTGSGVITLTGSSAFSTIQVADNTDVTASTSSDTLTFVGGDNVVIQTSGNTITFHSTGNIAADDSTSFDDIITGEEGRLAYYVETGNTLAQTGSSVEYDAVTGNFTATNLITNTVSSTDSSAVTVNDGLIVTGNFAFDGGVAVSTILDEDAMSSDSATALATQQSIKAYVDANAGGTLGLGDDASSSGSVAVSSGEQLMFHNGDSITATVSDNGVTVDLNESITVDQISAGDSTAVTLASPIIANSTIKFNGDLQSISSIKDEDNMASDSETALATQQSIKAYVDSSVGGLTTTMNFSDSSSNTGTVTIGTNDLEFRSGNSITATAAGTGVTFALNDAITVDDITAKDSSAININSPIQVAGNINTDTSLTVAGTTVTQILDEDAMGSDSATALATQQSIKAYVDSQTSSIVTTIGISDSSSSTSTLTLGSQDLEFRSGDSITATVAGTGVSFSLNDDITVNQIGAKDSSAVSITSPLQGTTIQTSGAVTAAGGFVGALTGNATTATTASAVDPNSVALGGDTTGNYVASITNGNYITGGDGGSEGAGLTLAVDATDANTASKVVARDGSGNFSAGTITASLTGNVTAGSGTSTFNDVSIAGDLTVSGTTTTINTTNTSVEDTLLALNTGVSAVANTSDSGILINRGTGADSSAINVAMIWDESENEFAMIETTEDGTTTGNVAITRYANLQVDRLTGTATQAQYADLAEMYSADADYEPGTVMIFGGDKEITQSTITHDSRVAGVVSTDPAHLMNATLENGTSIALQGRVPCKVKGIVRKGDLITTSNIPGVATKMNKDLYEIGCVIGKALEDHNSAEQGVIEVVVGRV